MEQLQASDTRSLNCTASRDGGSGLPDGGRNCSQKSWSEAPDQIETAQIDVTCPDAPEKLAELIDRVGGMDVFLLSSGIGSQNRNLNSDIELSTVQTNTVGFTQMVISAYDYFKKHGSGQLAVISSIAGTKGLGAAPSYSATKRYQNTYIEALDQLAQMEKLPIVFTDIRPGFVKTDC